MTQEKIFIDADRAIQLLHEARNSKGYDYVDQNSQCGGCRNTEWDRDESKYVPSCIVGHVLVAAGVPVDTLSDFNGSITTTRVGLTNELGPDAFEITKEATVVLVTAQRAQDEGKSWGSAVDYADDVFAILAEDGVK